jgi:hypothetical protein
MDRMSKEVADRLRLTMRKHDLTGCLLSGSPGAGYTTGTWSMPFLELDHVSFPVEKEPIVWGVPGSYQQVQDVEHRSLKSENCRYITGINYGTHNHPNVKTWLEKHPRFVLHFTPTSSSWLESGRTLVRGDHTKTDLQGRVQKRTGIGNCH